MNYKPTQQTLDIVKRLGGNWQGNYAMCCCPAHADSTPSLSIKQGRTTILVNCFAGCTGEDIMSAIRSILGRPIGHDSPEAAPPQASNDTHKRIWDAAMPIEGTLAERYLRNVRKIMFLPPDTRFHPRCPKGKGKDAQFLPALLVGIYRLGNLCAIQRLFLDPDTAERTDRMILGNSRGGIWPRHNPQQRLFVAEGFETACAFHQISAHPVATCFGDKNFAGFLLPPATKHLTILPDNDHEGLTLAKAAVDARATPELIVDQHFCPKHFNDWAEILNPVHQ